MPSFSRLLRRWTSTRRTNARRRAPSSSDVRAPDEAPVPGYDRVAAGYGLPPGYEVAMRGMPPRYVEKTSGEDPAAASAKPPRYQRVQASSVLDDIKHEMDTLSRQMEQELSREFKSDLPSWRQTAALRASSDEQFRASGGWLDNWTCLTYLRAGPSTFFDASIYNKKGLAIQSSSVNCNSGRFG